MKQVFKTMALLVAVSGMLVLSSCGKEPALEVDPLYQGWWEASTTDADYSLVIELLSLATYTEVRTNGVTITATGRAKIKENTLYVGTKKFSIDQTPQEDAQSVKTMILDGVTYTDTW